MLLSSDISCTSIIIERRQSLDLNGQSAFIEKGDVATQSSGGENRMSDASGLIARRQLVRLVLFTAGLCADRRHRIDRPDPAPSRYPRMGLLEGRADLPDRSGDGLRRDGVAFRSRHARTRFSRRHVDEATGTAGLRCARAHAVHRSSCGPGHGRGRLRRFGVLVSSLHGPARRRPRNRGRSGRSPRFAHPLQANQPPLEFPRPSGRPRDRSCRHGGIERPGSSL